MVVIAGYGCGHLRPRRRSSQRAVGGGNKADFDKAGFATPPGWTYRDMWWVSHNEQGAYAARGIHGPAIYIDPKAEMVIARFASFPLAANSNLDPTTLPAFHALAKYLMR